MGVLIEALNVVVPVAVLAERYPGGVARYEREAPNRTFCSDGHLTRVGFMAPTDVQRFVDSLVAVGLRFHDGTAFVDMAVVDQFQGVTSTCRWLECGRHPRGFSVAWLRDTSPTPMACPAGWMIEQSTQFTFVPNAELASRLLPLMRDGTVDVVLDYATGREAFIGRTAEQ